MGKVERIHKDQFNKLEEKALEFFHNISNHPFPIGLKIFYNLMEKTFEIDLYGSKTRYINKNQKIDEFCKDNNCIINYKNWPSKKQVDSAR